MASKRRRLNQAGGDPFRLPTDEFDRIPPPVRCDQQFAAAPPPVRYNQHFATASPPPESEPGDMEDWGEMPLDPREWGTNEEAPPEAGYWQEDGEEAPPEAGYWQEDGEEVPPEAGYWQEDGEEAPPEAGYWQEDGEEAPPEPRGDDEAAPAESDYWDPLAEPGDEAPAVPGELDDGEVAPAELGCCVGGEEVPTEPGDYNDEIPADTADWKGVGEASTDMVVREDGGEALPQPGGWEDDKEAVSFLLESLTRNQLINLLLSAAASYPGTLAEIHNIADRNPANRNIFVHSLSLCTTDDSLAAAFASYGEIEDCHVVTDKNTGRSKGYGFVLFRHALSARRALSQPQRSIDNQVAVCQLASAGPPQISPNNPFPDKMGRKIYVGNLPWVVDADRLKYFFAQYGEIEEGPLGFDRNTGKCRGYALFVYRTAEGAQKATEVPQKTYLGRQIYCRMAQSKSKISASYANANAPPNAQSSRGGYNQPGNDGPPPGYNGSAYSGNGPPGFSDSRYGSDQHPGCNGGYDESVYGGTQSGFEGSGYGGPPPGFEGYGYGGAPHKGSGYGGAPPSFNTSGYGGAPPNESGYDGPPPGYNSSGYGGPPPGFNGYVHVGPGGPPLGFNGSGHGCPPPDMMHAAQQSPMMAMEMLRMGVQPPGQALSSNAMLAGAWQNPTASGFMPNMFASAVRGPGGMQGMPPYAVPPTDPVQGFGMMNAVYQNAGFQGPPGFSDIPCQGGGGGSYQGEDGGSYQGGGGGSNQGGGGGEGGAYQDGLMGHGQIANPPAGPMGEYRSQEGI